MGKHTANMILPETILTNFNLLNDWPLLANARASGWPGAPKKQFYPARSYWQAHEVFLPVANQIKNRETVQTVRLSAEKQQFNQ